MKMPSLAREPLPVPTQSSEFKALSAGIRSGPGNAFLRSLLPDDLALVSQYLLPIQLYPNQLLHRQGEHPRPVIFPQSGLVSFSLPLQDGRSIAVAWLGCDSLIGAAAATSGGPAIHDARVFIGGVGHQMPIPAFRSVLQQSPHVRRLVSQFETLHWAHVQQTAVCNAAHGVEKRLCRLLLEIQDRTSDDCVTITHERLAEMLGVRRTTVSLICESLQAAEVIYWRRGRMQILCPDDLRRRSCECYQCVLDCERTIFAPRSPTLMNDSSAHQINLEPA
jgi:CRP-like cAMP-binding protein